MTGDIKIGAQTVTMCGNAATPIRFKQVFRKDLLMSLKGMTEENFDSDIIKELAYIMTKQAENADFKQLTFESFCDWLAQFEDNDLLVISADIINLWMQNTVTSVKSKKK